MIEKSFKGIPRKVQIKKFLIYPHEEDNELYYIENNKIIIFIHYLEAV